MRISQFSGLTAFLLALAAAGCQSTYYGAWESLGVHKRDILVERVEKARDDQQQAKEQFTSALEQFRSVVEVGASDLEDKYDTLREELDESEDAARDVRSRIDAIESVATALFEEWEAELDDYTSESLRRSSEQQLRATGEKYDTMITAMRGAEASMEPVLAAFRDQVLYLKHNLNARAIASIQDNAVDLQNDIEALIEQMQRSIDEANEFIESMSAEPGG